MRKTGHEISRGSGGLLVVYSAVVVFVFVFLALALLIIGGTDAPELGQVPGPWVRLPTTTSRPLRIESGAQSRARL